MNASSLAAALWHLRPTQGSFVLKLHGQSWIRPKKRSLDKSGESSDSSLHSSSNRQIWVYIKQSITDERDSAKWDIRGSTWQPRSQSVIKTSIWTPTFSSNSPTIKWIELLSLITTPLLLNQGSGSHLRASRWLQITQNKTKQALK